MEELADKEKIDEQLLRSHAGVDDIEERMEKEKDAIRDISYTKGPYNFSEANEFGLITR